MRLERQMLIGTPQEQNIRVIIKKIFGKPV